MDCAKTTRGLSKYTDGRVTGPERQDIQRHLDRCVSCSNKAVGYRNVRASLRTLPRRSVPRQTTTALLVIASRERTRLAQRRGFLGHWNRWMDYAHLALNNLIRPLMLPAAGGLFSATLLFGILAPNLAFALRPLASSDVPTGLFTEVSVRFTEASLKESVPQSISSSQVILILRVDEQGRMVDYQVARGQKLLQNEALRRRLETTLLVTHFNPANLWGQPTAGEIVVSFSTDGVDVKG